MIHSNSQYGTKQFIHDLNPTTFQICTQFALNGLVTLSIYSTLRKGLSKGDHFGLVKAQVTNVEQQWQQSCWNW
jgi:hypothetical protein